MGRVSGRGRIRVASPVALRHFCHTKLCFLPSFEHSNRSPLPHAPSPEGDSLPPVSSGPTWTTKPLQQATFVLENYLSPKCYTMPFSVSELAAVMGVDDPQRVFEGAHPVKELAQNHLPKILRTQVEADFGSESLRSSWLSIPAGISPRPPYDPFCTRAPVRSQVLRVAGS